MAISTASRQYSVLWNGVERTLELPAERITAELRFTDLPGIPDPASAIIQAMERPIASRPLREMVKPGATVAILVGDRMTDVMLGSRDHLAFPILDHLNGLGVRDEDVTIVYACGMHPHGHAESRIGPEVLSRVRLVVHQGEDDSQVVYVGATSRGTPVWVNRAVAEADVRIGLGEVSPVGPAGWCGGGKIILPGVCGRDTIEHNHRMVISPSARLGAVEDNPVRLDIEEAASLVGLDLKVDLLVNSDQRIVAVFAGDFRKEWREAIRLAREIWTTEMSPTDVAVLYPGEARERYLGAPVYMTLGIGDLMTRPGGAIVLSLSAAGGWSQSYDGGHGPTQEMFSLPSTEIARRMVRSEGSIRGLHIAYMGKVVAERKPVFLHCEGFDDASARALGFAGAFGALEAALEAASERVGDSEASISTSFPRGIQWRMMPRGRE